MADRIEQFAVTAPAATAKATPLEVPCRFDPGELEEIEIVVPDGHAGATGIALALAHQVIVPATPGQYIVSNDEVIHWPVAHFPNSGAWSAFVYNVDITPHTWYVRFLIRELGSNVRLSEPTAPGEAVTIGVGSGDLSGGSDSIGGVIEVGGDGDVIPPDDTGPPPDDTGPPPDDTEPPPDDTGQADLPPEPPPEPEPEPPPPPPPPPPPVITTYPLPGDYTPGAVPWFGNPGNAGMLIGNLLGVKMIDSGSNANGSYNTWRIFSDLGNTADWNFYYSGAKALQWVGPFNLRTGVPGG